MFSKTQFICRHPNIYFLGSSLSSPISHPFTIQVDNNSGVASGNDFVDGITTSSGTYPGTTTEQLHLMFLVLHLIFFIIDVSYTVVWEEI